MHLDSVLQIRIRMDPFFDLAFLGLDLDWIRTGNAYKFNKKLNFYIKNVLKVGNRSKIYLLRSKKQPFLKSGSQFISQFGTIFLLLDPEPEPHS
jgi:hypothetical protein